VVGQRALTKKQQQNAPPDHFSQSEGALCCCSWALVGQRALTKKRQQNVPRDWLKWSWAYKTTVCFSQSGGAFCYCSLVFGGSEGPNQETRTKCSPRQAQVVWGLQNHCTQYWLRWFCRPQKALARLVDAFLCFFICPKRTARNCRGWGEGSQAKALEGL